VVLWFYTKSYRKIEVKNLPVWFYITEFFYILYLLSFFYSENKNDALFNIHSKYGLLLFPLLLVTYMLNKEDLKKILLAFCFSNIGISIYLLARALFFYAVLQQELFTYNQFSILLHPTYASMFMVFSIAILFLTDFNLIPDKKKNNFIKICLSLLLIISVLLSSSKTGIITLGITLSIIFIYYTIALKEIKYSLSIALILVFMSFVFIKIAPTPLVRFERGIAVLKDYKQIDKTDTESTRVRIQIWEIATNLIAGHPVLGVGVGDVSNSLFKAYEEKSFYNLLIKRYNAHNQYLETTLGLGFIGFLFLLLLTFGLLINAFLKQKLIIFIFCILIILNFLVESMLEWQIGVVFFSFFASLLSKALKQEPITKV
jgi:O-antigen ligase